MKLNFCPYELEFKHPFGVSSNIRTHTPTVFVRIEHEEFFGYGEACLPKYLGETTADTIAFLMKAKKLIDSLASPFPGREILDRVDALSERNNAGKAAIDIALMDLIGKLSKQPYYGLMGFGKSKPTLTSSTIGLDDDEKIAQKIAEAADFKILKIKAGTADDKALVKRVREYTDKPLYVDANQGWTDKYFVTDMLFWLHQQNVLLAEQPMPVHMLDETADVTAISPIPVIADESVKRLGDIEKIKGAFSGINIKLMKSTGLSEAKAMIDSAKANNLKVMLGCMAESSCATSAMAQLMKFGDFIDLDAPNLIVNDPFTGVKFTNGKVELNDEYGIGVTRNRSLAFEG